MKTDIQTTLFRQTKLHRPPVSKDHLHRQRLLDLLNRGLGRPLTLVSAPAGYGKSTLISSWLEMSHIPGSWFSLDEQDNDLRFTDSEVKEYLRITLKDQVEELTTVELASKTEGWVTVLHLAVLASRGKDASIGVLSRLKGTSAYVMDYLMTEVLDALPPAIQHFLLSTSILDRFTASFCDALRGPDCGQGNSEIHGVDFIAILKDENLFLIALDNEDTIEPVTLKRGVCGHPSSGKMLIHRRSGFRPKTVF